MGISQRVRAAGRPHCTLWALVVVALLSGAHPALSADHALASALRSVLTDLPHETTRTGACVIDLTSGRAVFAANADEPMTPASTMKLFVMTAALLELGPEFAFETRCATDGKSVYVIGDGDPAFGDEKTHRAHGEPIATDFERWADILRQRGLDEIPGDLVIDESIFDDQWLHPTWDARDLDNWYAAPVGGLNFNDNCVDITIWPAETPGAPVHVAFQPPNSLVRIVNECRSGGKGKPILRHPFDSFEYRITGHCTKRWPFVAVSFPDPGLLFADSFRTVLSEKGIRVGGEIVRRRVRDSDGDLPASLSVIATRRTPLAEVLARVGKDSQNLFAECLLKRTGYAWARRQGETNPQGSWSLGVRAITQIVRRAGLDEHDLIIADGSGLSRENTCSAAQLARLLAWIARRPEGALLRENLSAAGVDGSLRKRLPDIPGVVYAKTGTMRGVRTLAGYVLSDGAERADPGRQIGPTMPSDGESAALPNMSRPLPREVTQTYAFAVLFNGYPGPSTPYRRIQDRFCRILAEHAANDTRAHASE